MRKCVYPLSPLFSGGLLLFPCPQFRSRIYYIVFFYVTFNLVYFILICLSYIFLLLIKRLIIFFSFSSCIVFFSLRCYLKFFESFSLISICTRFFITIFYLVTNHRLLASFYYLYFFAYAHVFRVVFLSSVLLLFRELIDCQPALNC